MTSGSSIFTQNSLQAAFFAASIDNAFTTKKDFHCTQITGAIKVLLPSLTEWSFYSDSARGSETAVMTNAANGFPRKLLPLITLLFYHGYSQKASSIYFSFQYSSYPQKYTIQEISVCIFFSRSFFGKIEKITKNTPKGGNIDETR